MKGFTWLKRKPAPAPAVDVTKRPEIDDLMTGEPVRVIYTNWRGETALRTIQVQYIWRGVTAYHANDTQVLVRATDVDRGVPRDFALKDMVLA